ncbi:hypothetical protein AALP_AA4G255700 [Arabis alpina]|uniref:Protein TILLER ANGLE CONTROL 1 n=1 Tax=Arabis alpina TaxID=50452 RepID=A0A087H5M5_ARAAL|nr:hypothetical protein AALP_AA4G255700 [Arabis alpina]
MTIFNWVQKKLHRNVIKDGVTKNEKKKSEGISEIEKNTKAILDQVGLVDALDNWFDGVLTIGTFGFDTLKFQEEEEEEIDDDDECESVDLDYVVIDGSIVKNINQELDPLISSENDFYDHHHDLKEFDTDHYFNPIKTVERPMVAVTVAAEMEPQKKRTTLAELFDQDEGDDTWLGKKPKNPNLDHVKTYKQNKSKLSTKFLFAKKKTNMSKSKDKEKDSRPIKKVQQMIKRMLKKKIHPDIDATKAFKNDVVPYKPTQKCETLESRYLLNITQDCVA